MSDHEIYIRQTYALAQRAVEHGNHPFGALLVHEGQVLVTARNTVITAHDPTRHAELRLVSKAARRFGADILAESILYTSTEPCAMCAGAIYWSGIRTVVYGCSAAALAGVTDHDFLIPSAHVFSFAHDPIQLVGPILEQEGMIVHQGFW